MRLALLVSSFQQPQEFRKGIILLQELMCLPLLLSRSSALSESPFIGSFLDQGWICFLPDVSRLSPLVMSHLARVT